MSLCCQKSMFVTLSRHVAAKRKRTYKGEVKLGNIKREREQVIRDTVLDLVCLGSQII